MTHLWVFQYKRKRKIFHFSNAVTEKNRASSYTATYKIQLPALISGYFMPGFLDFAPIMGYNPRLDCHFVLGGL